MSKIESLSAVTLSVRDMARALEFYRAAGFALYSGALDSSFSTLSAGRQFLNLTTEGSGFRGFWGRVIFYVADVDATYRRLTGTGLTPKFTPRDAPWGERYFHILDPDGHEISFARPLNNPSG